MTETRRLYYEDVYKKEFTAKVLECREAKKGFHIILNESAFYPEGGGQPSDIGYLGDVKVKEVHEKDGELLHYTDKPLEAGTEVQGRINWARRFDLMQQHSGEHMVSGLIHEAYGYDNVGFHMGSDTITVDLNGPLDETQLAEIEQKTNEKIWEDTEVKILYPTAEELEKIDYRSKKELTGQVRIVEFPGVDICACCGTHVTRTGEIGMVKLLSVVKFREGVRMEMLSGKRVLDYLNMINEQNRQISVKLSAKMDKTASAVARLQDENFALKGRVHALEEEFIVGEAAKWKEKENIDFSLYGTPIESTTYKFAKCLQKRFGKIEGVTDKNYITNSYHIHVTEHINAFDKLTFESQFQKLSPGGAISYVEVPDMQDNIDAVLAVMKHIYNNIMYAELNTKSDYCMACGYDGEIQIEKDENGKLIWVCPNCGNKNQDMMSVARRTCGYIGTQFWNQGRTQEIKERVLHL